MIPVTGLSRGPQLLAETFRCQSDSTHSYVDVAEIPECKDFARVVTQLARHSQVQLMIMQCLIQGSYSGVRDSEIPETLCLGGPVVVVARFGKRQLVPVHRTAEIAQC